jgi:two-component system chemotaxis response regulator CheB
MSAAVRVLVVDDSPSVCRLLAGHLGSAGDVEVVGMAHDGERAVALVRALRPQVVTLDLQMPGAGGLAALEEIMRDCPTAVLVVSGVNRRAAEVTLQALALGAVDFILKYTPGSATDPDALRREVVTKVRLAARVKVIRSLGPTQPRPPGASRFVPLVKRAAPAEEQAPLAWGEDAPSVLVVGASTGGPRALGELLRELPADFPAAVLVVQHLPAALTPELAAHLRRLARLPVKEAEVGDRLQPGRALVAPGGRHLLIGPEGQVGLIGARWVAGPSPSIDLTMQSAARFAGQRAAGVVLTGMGADGAQGLSAIRARGGVTFAQDAASCVIFGMPQQAIARGAVDHVAPPAEIGRRLRGLQARKGEMSRGEAIG